MLELLNQLQKEKPSIQHLTHQLSTYSLSALLEMQMIFLIEVQLEQK